MISAFDERFVAEGLMNKVTPSRVCDQRHSPNPGIGGAYDPQLLLTSAGLSGRRRRSGFDDRGGRGRMRLAGGDLGWAPRPGTTAGYATVGTPSGSWRGSHRSRCRGSGRRSAGAGRGRGCREQCPGTRGDVARHAQARMPHHAGAPVPAAPARHLRGRAPGGAVVGLRGIAGGAESCAEQWDVRSGGDLWGRPATWTDDGDPSPVTPVCPAGR